jgi:hypothetical protein
MIGNYNVRKCILYDAWFEMLTDDHDFEMPFAVHLHRCTNQTMKRLKERSPLVHVLPATHFLCRPNTLRAIP